MGALKDPHGGVLKNLYLDEAGVKQEKARARDLPSWDLNMRQLCDIEMLLNGAFSPLEGFLGEADYQRVLSEMRLTSGVLWPMPITLDVTEKFAEKLKQGDTIALRDGEGVLTATMEISSIYRPDFDVEAKAVYGTTDLKHPAVSYLKTRSNPVYLGGKLRGVDAPVHYDFKHLRDTPKEVRDRFQKLGWRRIVAFQTRNPMHRAHQELTFRAAKDVEASLLIHPVVGMTKPGDVDHFTRVRCYEHLVKAYPEQTTALSLLPLAMRMGGPREAVWHAIIRKNYGCTHFIVGRDHAGPGNDSNGKPFYGPYDAQELMKKHEKELDISMVPFKNMVYVEDKAQYFPEDEVEKGTRTLDISGTELRRRLQEGADIPEWFSFPAVVAELRRTHPPRHKQGFHGVLHGPLGLGQVHRRERADGQAHGDGRPAGDAARRRPRAQALVERARLLEGAPRSQHPAHRLCGQRNHEERRHRDLRADRAVRGDAQDRARDDRAARRLHRDPCRDADRGLRGSRSQGPLCQGACRHYSKALRASTIRTRRRRTRRCGSTRRSRRRTCRRIASS